MRDKVEAEVDKQTGLITVKTTLPDSAVARHITRRLVETASAAFVRVSRAQATSQRTSQAERVDSAQLVQTTDMTHLWAESYDRDVSDVLAIQREVAMKIAHSLTLALRRPRGGHCPRAGGDASRRRRLIPARLPPDPRHTPLARAATALAFPVATSSLGSESSRMPRNSHHRARRRIFAWSGRCPIALRVVGEYDLQQIRAT
jgi:hypothetical protein